MSSILEALKKLEQEQDEKPQDVDWSQPLNPKNTMYNRLTETSSRKPVFIGTVLVLVLVIGMSVLMTRMPASAPPQETSATDEKEAMAQTPQRYVEPRPMEKAPMPETAVKQEPRVPKPQTIENNVTMNQGQSAWKPLRSEDFLTESGEKDAVREPKNELSLETPDFEESIEEEASAEATNEDPADAGLDEEMTELLEHVPKELLPPQKVAQSGWLTLQAISWSDEPSRRVAVINSQLVKEGRHIDGAVVTRIEHDYVVITKNGEELLLPFGNH